MNSNGVQSIRLSIIIYTSLFLFSHNTHLTIDLSIDIQLKCTIVICLHTQCPHNLSTARVATFSYSCSCTLQQYLVTLCHSQDIEKKLNSENYRALTLFQICKKMTLYNSNIDLLIDKVYTIDWFNSVHSFSL